MNTKKQSEYKETKNNYTETQSNYSETKMTTKRHRRQKDILLRGEFRHFTFYHKCEPDGGAGGKEDYDQSHWDSSSGDL